MPKGQYNRKNDKEPDDFEQRFNPPDPGNEVINLRIRAESAEENNKLLERDVEILKAQVEVLQQTLVDAMKE